MPTAHRDDQNNQCCYTAKKGSCSHGHYPAPLGNRYTTRRKPGVGGTRSGGSANDAKGWCRRPEVIQHSVDFGTVIFVAAALGLGTLVNVSGIGSAVGQGFTQLMETDNGGSFGDFISLSLMATLTGVVATTPSVPTVLSPMAAELAGASGSLYPPY